VEGNGQLVVELGVVVLLKASRTTTTPSSMLDSNAVSRVGVRVGGFAFGTTPGSIPGRWTIDRFPTD
jgi:hypothetical protein